MSKRIGILWNTIEKYTFDRKVQYFDYAGDNLGNLVYLEGLHKLLGSNVTHVPWHSPAKYVEENFDALVLPAANQLGSHTDLGSIAELWESYNVPIIVLGLGIQSVGEKIILSEGTQNWLRVLVDSSIKFDNPIGVRGSASNKLILEHYPYANLKITGCPSVAIGIANSDLGKQLNNNKNKNLRKILLNSGDLSWKGTLADHKRYIYEVILNNGAYVIQAPRELYDILNDPENPKNIPYIEEFNNKFNLEANGINPYSFFAEYGKYFYSVEDWMTLCRNYDYCVGFRIHGYLVSTYSGVPSLLTIVDSRTKELSETLGLLTVNFDENKSLEQIKQKIVDFNYDEMLDKWEFNLAEINKIIKNI